MNKSLVLLKTLLLSTSQWNIYKNCKDKKKRGRVVGNAIGMGVLYLMLMGYSIAQCVGYGMMGLESSIPVMCALVISALAFFLTFFKTNGYLFNFKEYDMLMSLPYQPKDIAACKFLYMYINSLPWYLSVSLAMMIGYGIYASASVGVYPIWFILTLFLPIIPMLGTSFLGFLIAKLGSGFKNKTLIQTVLTFLFIMLCFASRFFLHPHDGERDAGLLRRRRGRKAHNPPGTCRLQAGCRLPRGRPDRLGPQDGKKGQRDLQVVPCPYTYQDINSAAPYAGAAVSLFFVVVLEDRGEGFLRDLHAAELAHALLAFLLLFQQLLLS